MGAAASLSGQAAYAAEGDGSQAGSGACSLMAVTAQAMPDYDIEWYLSDEGAEQYVLDTAAQLRGLAQLVNGTAVNGSAPVGAVTFEGKTVFLGGNIDLDGTEFTPIGTSDHPFAGTFDGQGKNVSNMRITQAMAYSGLFGHASETSTIKDVKLVNGSKGGMQLSTGTAYIGCVGSLAGKTDGLVSGCTSNVAVSIASTAQTSASMPCTVQKVGGLVGYARATMMGCSYTGELTATIGGDAYNADSTSDSLRVGDSIGGVVGRFGDPDKHGSLYDSFNLGDVTVQTTGVGAKDRFGAITHAVAFYVGGVAGYSNGSVYRCHNGSYNELTREVTGKVFTGVNVDGSLANNRGASEVGGIVGGLRGNSEDPARHNDGDPSDPVVVTDCYNEAQITGLNAIGGIVGQAGVYTTITRCYNGTITDLTDWQRNQAAGKIVTTRWNKPLSGGICGQTRSGTISYCANYAEVRNIQTGYYMAGIVGGMFVSDDYPNVTGELYACFNSGGIYTLNRSTATEYREAGICGENEGYVHDCIVLKGSVPFHSDQAIGDMEWGSYANLVVKDADELASPQSAALLNAVASQTGDWSSYWFVNGQGYPVLNGWVEGGSVELTSASVKSVVQVSPAPYVGQGAAAMPTLQVTLVDGTVLVQDTDFRVIPQAGAFEMSAGLDYTAGIEGIGMYRGTVENCARYSIGAASLSTATVQVSPMKYNFGKVVFPESVEAKVFGSAIDASEFDYVIYNSATTAEKAVSGNGAFAVLDSKGYISYDKNGNEKIPIARIDGGLAAINAETRDWWLWNRDGKLISDSAGNSYYTTGNVGAVYGANTSCVNLKSGTPAGYVVKVSAAAQSTVLEGDAIGYYTIEPVNLYQDCTFESASVNGETWAWDANASKFTTGGQVVFTGQTVQPDPTIKFGDYTLSEGVDYRIVCGDPDPSEAGVTTNTAEANRNVTTVSGAPRAAITVLPQNVSNMSNYIIAYFDIVPAKFEDCDITVSKDEWAYTGQEVKPDVKVTLNGVTLQEGVDYEVSFAGNVNKGQNTASYTVTPLANLSGGSTEPRTGTFSIVDGTPISTLTVDAIADQQFNWGYDVHPTLVFRDGQGNVLALEEGADYDIAYSTNKITKWSVNDAIDPCTATITGKGIYTGSIAATFHIVPYNATANATNQLRAVMQDMPYGTWGAPATGPEVKLSDGKTALRDGTVNVGPRYPVMAVFAYPVVDWAAYEAGDRDACYGSPIALGTNRNKTNGSLLSRYPARYYDALGNEVNGNGGAYVDVDGSVVATPAKATNGVIQARVYFRCDTGDGGGATGYLADTFMYTAPAYLSTVEWTVGSDDNRTYTGSALTPVVGTETGTGRNLVEGEDYAISYKDNVDAGVCTFTATAVEGADKMFTGVYEGKFTVMPANIAAAGAASIGNVPTQVMNDAVAGACPEPVVSMGGKTLVKDVDYELTYRNNHTVGHSAAVVVTGINNYMGSISKTFQIIGTEPLDISKASVAGLSGKAYTGAAYKQAPVVKLAGDTLVEGQDYTLAYFRGSSQTSDFASAGTITVRATGKGGYKGTASASYTIAAASLSGASVGGVSSFTYDGKAKTPSPAVKLAGRTLKAGTDYSLSYSGNVNAGTATVFVTGKGNYAGRRSVSFAIHPASIDGGVLGDAGWYVYDGWAKTPVPSLSVNGRMLAANADYALTYSNNVDAGVGVVQAVGRGNYTGSKAATFTIAKAAQPLTAKAKAKKVTVKYSKVKKKAQTTKAMVKVSRAQGKVTYKNVSKKKAVKKWKVNAKTGKVKVPKKTKKGTYTVKLRVTAAGNGNYVSGYKTVSFKVVVK